MSRTVRTALSALLLAVLSAVQLVAPPVATADVTTLCRGYTGCAQLGMGDGGYGRVSGSMYWRMYAGHNCTNYAAFRMIQDGMPDVRPWTGGGNATYWGTSMPQITDGVPTVGSVAWWRAGVYPAGSAGHVAYVERVVDENTIIVSQDSWGGDFSWARITRASRGWPSGFIHFNDAALTNSVRPSVTGTAKVGATLTATPGVWSPTASVTYQWRAAGVDVPGATGSTFTVAEGQLGQRVRVRVTAARAGYATTTATSTRTVRVQPGTFANATPPSVSGDPVVDGIVTAAAGTWHPAPASLAFQWLADGAPIQGATGAQLTPDASLVDSALSVRVTASGSGYADASVSSAASAPVRQAELTGVSAPSVSGTPRLGETLQLVAGSTSPESSPTVEWQRDGAVVAGASGTSYVLTPDDLGTRISARVRWGRPGYRPAEMRSVTTSRIKATPALAVQVRPRAERLRVRADVVAPEQQPLPAQLWIRVDGTREPMTLVDGTAVTLLTGLAPGTVELRVLVPRSPTVAAAAWTGEVTIPAR